MYGLVFLFSWFKGPCCVCQIWKILHYVILYCGRLLIGIFHIHFLDTLEKGGVCLQYTVHVVTIYGIDSVANEIDVVLNFFDLKTTQNLWKWTPTPPSPMIVHTICKFAYFWQQSKKCNMFRQNPSHVSYHSLKWTNFSYFCSFGGKMLLYWVYMYMLQGKSESRAIRNPPRANRNSCFS